MTLNLHDFSIPELEDLIKEAQQQIIAVQEQNIQSVYIECVRLAATLGLSIDDLISSARQKAVSNKAPRKVAPRYQCQESGQTWTGQGRTPLWLSAKLAAGAKLEDFRISQS